jgi:glycosyltransferase involved in cell wall biosynthesis
MTSCPVSVVVTTHNRAGILPTCVRATLAEVRRHPGAELLVVDNASSDDTPAVLAELARVEGSPLRTLHEPRLGASHGRNAGLAAARGDLIAFLDDDAVPRAGWLAALTAPLAEPAIAGVGGPLILRLSAPPPPWFTPDFHEAAGLYDLGSVRRRVHHSGGEWYPPSANLCLRTRDVIREGGFYDVLGPHGTRHFVHEDADLCARLDRSAGEIHYVPDAIVDHWIVPGKLTPQYFLDHHACFGEGAAVFALRNRSLPRILWGLRWYARYLAAVPYRPEEPIDPVRLLGECQRREALAYLRTLARSLPRLAALRRDPRGYST